MTTKEREMVRYHLLRAGFRKERYHDEPEHYDRAHDGCYVEVWRHKKDRTRIELHWDCKTEVSATDTK